ncbi:MAG: PD40 domain-containing protein [Planctomycetes bacterium]|nr:PD40 domain-containing protein [Planctomycetota bacterium]
MAGARARAGVARRRGGLLLLGSLAACSGGSGGLPLPSDSLPAEMVFVRSRIGQRFSGTDIRRADARGLDTRRVLDRSGIESDVRVHPDGNRLVFARQTRNGDPASSEIFVATLDGSAPELRVTVDNELDEAPCWSPQGDFIVFASERLGSGRRLFRVRPDGTDAAVLADDGADQTDPDWSASDGRIVFSRRGADRRELWLLDPVLRRTAALTTGGAGIAATREPGDVEPAWSPDGRAALFRRVLTDTASQLCAVDVATGAVTELTALDAGIDLANPRWSPHQDRVFFAADRPAIGIDGLRLWTARPDGSDAWLIYADRRDDYLGFDVLPAMRPADARAIESEAADLGAARIENGLGRPSRGAVDFVLERDGVVFGLATAASGSREIAGLDFRVPLQVADPNDVLVVEVSVTAAVTEPGPGDLLRIAIRNNAENRNDTVAELTPDGSLQTVAFPVTGLAYLDRDRNFGVTVVADKAGTRPGELWIDHVGLRVGRAVATPSERR